MVRNFTLLEGLPAFFPGMMDVPGFFSIIHRKLDGQDGKKKLSIAKRKQAHFLFR